MAFIESRYRASGLLKNPHIQSMLSGSAARQRAGLRRLQALSVQPQTQLLVLPDGIKLSGVYWPAMSKTPRALVLLLHGWEGSAYSSYISHSAAELVAQGFDVFALNFRDHGDSHGLNEGIFHSCRLQEIIDAAKWLLHTYKPAHFFVAGYSLGGNFALRLALSAVAHSVPIEAAFAICPAVDPAAVMRQLETGPAMYHWYFLRKWRASLRRKRALFPRIHHFDERILQHDMRGLTQWLVEQHTEWGSVERYFSGYSVAGSRLQNVQIPSRILAAADDPVIPISTLKNLHLSPCIEIEISQYGGHCGFIENWALGSFSERWLRRALVQALNALQ